MRADARRNYDKLVDAARQVFRERGYEAPLDEIARRAGVGPGTLYRHFPTKDALFDAVMQAWIEGVEAATEKALAREGSPRDVLVGWLGTYVTLVSTYKGNPARITAAMGDPNSPIVTKCQVLAGANQRVIDHLGPALRDEADAITLARLVGGVAAVADQAELPADAIKPLLDVLADGLLS
jgi:AcrR family transcriptional regulator